MAVGKGLSKRERKDQKKKRRVENQEKVRLEREREEKGTRTIKYGLLAAAFLVAGYLLIIKTPGVSGNPRITINPLEYDFGDVSMKEGVAKTVMTIKNEGDSNLVIKDMETSCGCTSATVEKNGKEGPVFGMKGHIPTPVSWTETLKPGETAILNVYYDPLVHPELRGPVTRLVTLYSNDPAVPGKEVKIFVNQVD